ncbi:MAG: DUF3785 family protein [Clostridium sp.]
MKNFKFKHNGEEFILSEDNLSYMEGDEIKDFDIEKVLEILEEGKEKIEFDYEYYADNCDECGNSESIDKKCYRFLEYHFYIFTKEEKYIMSNISNDFESTTYSQLERDERIDESYIVSVIVCESCKRFTVEIEQCDM